MSDLTKRARIRTEEEKKGGEASTRSHELEDVGRPVVDHSKAKTFSSLPRQLQEWVLLKTSTETRLKLFQINRQLREWVFKEGLFPRDVNGIKLTSKIIRNGRPNIFVISPRGIMGMYEEDVDINVVKVQKSMFKNIRSCWALDIESRKVDFLIAEFFPNLRSVAIFDICVDKLAALEGMTLEATRAFTISFLCHDHQVVDVEKLFELVDKHASRCPTINFIDVPFERIEEFLRARKFRFTFFSLGWFFIDYGRNDQIIATTLELILENGISGEHLDPYINITVSSWANPSDLWTQALSTLSKNGSLVMGDLERIRKKFTDDRAQAALECLNESESNEVVAFTNRFNKDKNLIFLLFKYDSLFKLDISIKYDSIEE